MWVAEFGHHIICCDLRKYSFSDKFFQTWIHRIFEILHSEGYVEDLRKKLLSEEEQINIQTEIDEGLYL